MIAQHAIKKDFADARGILQKEVSVMRIIRDGSDDAIKAALLIRVQLQISLSGQDIFLLTIVVSFDREKRVADRTIS